MVSLITIVMRLIIIMKQPSKIDAIAGARIDRRFPAQGRDQGNGRCTRLGTKVSTISVKLSQVHLANRTDQPKPLQASCKMVSHAECSESDWVETFGSAQRGCKMLMVTQSFIKIGR